MNTHRQIIGLWPSRAEFARDLGLDYQLVRGWNSRNSIPPEYWVDVVRAAKNRGFDRVTNDLLATIKAADRNRAEAAA